MKGGNGRRGSMSSRGDSDESNELYASDDFRIYCMKVLPCSKRFCHDWTKCPFAHTGEKARRRDPRVYNYTGIACPDMKTNQCCPRKDNCPMSHSAFEFWLHPSRYRTQLCKDGTKCARHVCFFAHTVAELRVPAAKPTIPLGEIRGDGQLAANMAQASFNQQGGDPTAMLLAALVERLPQDDKVAAYLAKLEADREQNRRHSASFTQQDPGVQDLLRALLRRQSESRPAQRRMDLHGAPSAPAQLPLGDVEGLDLSMSHRSTSYGDSRGQPLSLADFGRGFGSLDYSSSASFDQHRGNRESFDTGSSLFPGGAHPLGTPLGAFGMPQNPAMPQSSVGQPWQQDTAQALNAYQQSNNQAQQAMGGMSAPMGGMGGRQWGPSPEFLQGLAQGLKLPTDSNPQGGVGAPSSAPFAAQWSSPLADQLPTGGSFSMGFPPKAPLMSMAEEGPCPWANELYMGGNAFEQARAAEQQQQQSRNATMEWAAQQGVPQQYQRMRQALGSFPPQQGNAPPQQQQQLDFGGPAIGQQGPRSSMESAHRSSLDSAADNQRMSIDFAGRAHSDQIARLDEQEQRTSSPEGEEAAPTSPQEWLSRLPGARYNPLGASHAPRQSTDSIGNTTGSSLGSDHGRIASMAAQSLFANPPYNARKGPKTVALDTRSQSLPAAPEGKLNP